MPTLTSVLKTAKEAAKGAWEIGKMVVYLPLKAIAATGAVVKIGGGAIGTLLEGVKTGADTVTSKIEIADTNLKKKRLNQKKQDLKEILENEKIIGVDRVEIKETKVERQKNNKVVSNKKAVVEHAGEADNERDDANTQGLKQNINKDKTRKIEGDKQNNQGQNTVNIQEERTRRSKDAAGHAKELDASAAEEQTAVETAQVHEESFQNIREEVAQTNQERALAAESSNKDYLATMNLVRKHNLGALEAEKAEEIAGKIYELARDLIELRAEAQTQRGQSLHQTAAKKEGLITDVVEHQEKIRQSINEEKAKLSKGQIDYLEDRLRAHLPEVDQAQQGTIREAVRSQAAKYTAASQVQTNFFAKAAQNDEKQYSNHVQAYNQSEQAHQAFLNAAQDNGVNPSQVMNEVNDAIFHEEPTYVSGEDEDETQQQQMRFSNS